MYMDKTEIIARRILGWKLNRWDRWYNPESKQFIAVEDFQPAQRLEHAMMIVNRLKQTGYDYKIIENNQACFNGVCASGASLAEAITEAAFAIADNRQIPDGWL